MFSLSSAGVDLQFLVAQATGVMFVTWFAIYFASYPLSAAFFKKSFTSLTASQKYEWASRVVSTVHALIGIGFAYYTMFFEGELHNMPIPFPERMTIGVALTAATTLSYWLYDLILIVKNWKEMPDYLMVIHHLCGIIPFALGSYYSEYMAFAPTIVIAETSTPFVNARWFMYITNNTGSLIYAINGLGMWLSFLLCRIWWLPYGLQSVILNYSTWAAKYHLSVLIPVTIGTPIAYGLSCYWWVLITKGLVKTVWKMIKGDSGESKLESNNSQAKKVKTN